MKTKMESILIVDYANQNSMKKRGHVLIWYNQIPSWLEQESPNWTSIMAMRSCGIGLITVWIMPIT